MNLRHLILLLLLIHLGDSTLAQITKRQIDSLSDQAKNINDFDSIFKMTDQIIAKSNAIKYDLGLVTGVLIKTASLFNCDRFEDALKLTIIWENKVLELNDNARIVQLYCLRANSYGRLLFFEKSKEYLEKAEIYVEKIEEVNSKSYNLSRIYIIKANNIIENTAVHVKLDSALYYLKKANNIQKKTLGKTGIKVNYIISGNFMGNVFLQMNNLDSAKFYYEQSVEFSRLIKIDKYSVKSYIGLGDVNFLKKNLDIALIYYQHALKIALKIRNSGNIKQCYKKLASVYEELGEVSKSYEYLKKYGAIADSLTNANPSAVKNSSDIILKEKETAFARTSMYYILAILGSTLSLIALTYLFILFRKNHKKTVAIHKKRQEHLSEKLAHLKEKTSSDKVDDQSLKEIIQLAVSNDPAFLIKFQEHHSIFIQKLMDRAPSLVTSDLLICAQLRLGFYTKEIARYTKNSVRAVEGKKYRIRKKLNIPANEDINVWMMQV
ncbi:MAG: hypothetical protein EOP00_24625 [Pedobacter sp.]|nr:MAG: hypothetical protein EOP00_24625 [Pedobacter sp.]